MDAPESLIAETRAYVQEVLGQPLVLAQSPLAEVLPHFLRDRYTFLEGTLFARPCLFVAPNRDLDALEAPAGLARQLAQVASRSDATVILLLPVLAAYNRRRLIDHGINFIVPGAQLFLPALAVDLREHVRPRLRPPQPDRKRLSPTAQMIVIDALLDGRLHGLIAKDIAETLGVSAMAVSRAMEELRTTTFTAMEPQGSGFRLYFKVLGRALWDEALPLMGTPVRKLRGVSNIPLAPNVFLAGESALARYTSLADPPRTVFAIHDKDWKMLTRHGGGETGLASGSIWLETWSYAPGALARGKDIVDPLSLFLSLEADDERLAIAAEDLLEGVFG